jgi:ubiquinone/menaquinone biosynthesis C-methylase UbiE
MNNHDPARAIFDNLTRWAEPELRLDGSTLLEFGVGKRGFAEFYAQRCKAVTALDVIDYSAQHAGKPYTFLHYNGNKIPLPDASVRIVTSHSVLEHVADLPASMSEIDRVLRVGGYAFLTISPLYYSSWGSHIYVDGVRLDDWSHLDPASAHYLTREATRGRHFLNWITMSDFLSAVAMQPWDIVRMKRTYEHKTPPSGLNTGAASALDIISRGFQFLGRKTRVKP